MKRYLLFIVIASFLLTCVAVSQRADSLLIEGSYIKIGAPKNEVLSKFAEGYHVSKVREPDKYGIASTSAEHPRIIGYIEFEKGRVSSISKYWSDYFVESGGLKSFQALYSLLSNLTKQGFNLARLSTEQVQQPDVNADIITLTMGNRIIEVSIQNHPAVYGDRIAVHINETLSK